MVVDVRVLNFSFGLGRQIVDEICNYSYIGVNGKL